MEALTAEDDAACPGCGHPLDESTDETFEFTYEPHTVECIPCAEKAEYIKEKWGKEGAPPGTFVTITEGERVTVA